MKNHLLQLFSISLMKKVQHALKRMRYISRYWGFTEYCAACQRRSSRFLPFDLRPYHIEGGVIPPIVIPNTRCPWCYSHLHHRLMWTVLPKVIQDLKKNKMQNRKLHILHFAPERFSAAHLRNTRNVEYITTDIRRNDIMVQLDMCALGLSTESMDLIIASHVLEHVQDDRAALNELYRILRPGGVSILLVPILAEHSFEKNDVDSDNDRLRYFGQTDHVRAYGLDLRERIALSGFEVTVVYAHEFTRLNQPSYLLNIQGASFIAVKPPLASTMNSAPL